MPAAGQETAGLRRLGKALGEAWPVSLVCPQTRWYDRTCYPIEEAAAGAAAAIRACAPQVPFVIGGFCLGGIIAFETARTLQHEGCAGLLLFDTPVPGYPKFTLRSLRAGALGRFLKVLKQQWHRAGGRRRVSRFLLQRIAWNGVLLLRPLLRHGWRHAWLNRLLQGERIARTPFFWQRQVNVPILHFIVAPSDLPSFREAARLEWEAAAGKGITHRLIAGRHLLLFSRPNLPVLAAQIKSWCRTLHTPAENPPV